MDYYSQYTLSMLQTGLALMAVCLALNYLSNIAYLVLYCKYIRPNMILNRQVDIVTNHSLLTFAMLTNYRFALLPFSKMFRHPNVEVSN